MGKNTKGKTITFRLSAELHQKCIDFAIRKSVKEGKIFKISDIIREAINKKING